MQPGYMFDVHVHTAPDVQERSADDTTMARRYDDANFTGFVFKGHFETTASRAALAADGLAVDGYGGIVLNAHVGGFNPAAVWAALQMGARVVWMPTIDALAHRQAGLLRPYPSVVGLQSPSYCAPPLNPESEEPLRVILELIADADAVLATGHLSAAEVDWLLEAARHAGVQRVMLTHPSYTVPDLTHRHIAEFTSTGAYAEITAFQLLHQSTCDAADLAALIRAIGSARLVLSSDVGQPSSPDPPAALAQLATALEEQGIDDSAIEAMSSKQPEELVVP